MNTNQLCSIKSTATDAATEKSVDQSDGNVN